MLYRAIVLSQTLAATINTANRNVGSYTHKMMIGCFWLPYFSMTNYINDQDVKMRENLFGGLSTSRGVMVITVVVVVLMVFCKRVRIYIEMKRMTVSMTVSVNI